MTNVEILDYRNIQAPYDFTDRLLKAPLTKNLKGKMISTELQTSLDQNESVEDQKKKQF